MNPETRCRFRRSFPSGKQSVGNRLVLLSAIATVTMGLTMLGAVPLLAEGKKPEEFKAAIKAQDQEDWKRSIDLIHRALAKPQPEDGERVRIYGTRYISYLPHYYLGLALYKLGDCAGARNEWELSLNAGAIQASEEFKDLQAHLAECQSR